MGRQSPLSIFPAEHRTLVAVAILGLFMLVLPGQTPSDPATDPVIEVIEVEFPYWRLIFHGEVEGVPEPTELEAHHITWLEAGFRPLLERTERRRARDAGSTAVWAEAAVQGRVIGQAPSAYEVMETSRGDRVPSLLGSIENLRQLPETFSLVHRERGELLEMVAAPESPDFELTRMEHRDGAVELAWSEAEEGRTPRFEVFLSTDGFESYTRVHPEFYGDGEREAMRTTSFTFDPSRHYVADEAYYLLVLANEGLRTAWKAVRVTPPEEPIYEYQATIHDPEEGTQIWQDGFVTLSGSMAALIETPEHRFVGRPYRLQPVPATLEWISSQDGSIVRYQTDGSVFGVTCMARGLSAGSHRIILRAETPGGATTRTSVRVWVSHDGERPPARSFDCRVPEEFRIDG